MEHFCAEMLSKRVGFLCLKKKWWLMSLSTIERKFENKSGLLCICILMGEIQHIICNIISFNSSKLTKFNEVYLVDNCIVHSKMIAFITTSFH